MQDDLTFQIIGASQKVHRTLGPGYKESIYQAALCKELMLRNIPFDSQRQFEVHYEGMLCGTYRPDLVVDAKVICELKASCELCPEDRMQVIGYLKASGLNRGLLINFGKTSLEIRRLVNDLKKTIREIQ